MHQSAWSLSLYLYSTFFHDCFVISLLQKMSDLALGPYQKYAVKKSLSSETEALLLALGSDPTDLTDPRIEQPYMSSAIT